jgi:ribose transport system substrate-binding protein
MKRIILCAFIIVLMCVTSNVFAGGGGDKGSGAKQRIAVSLPPANNAWQAKMRQVIDEAVKLHPDYTWVVRNAVDDNDQLNQLTTFLNDKYDAMIILPGNGTLLTPICERIFDSGCKTIILDRGIESNKYTAEVKGDNYGGGVNAAKLLGQKLGGSGNVVVLRSYIGIPIDLDRYNGFMDTIKKDYPGIRVIAEADGEFNREAGQRAMNAILPAHPQIDAVYAQDDETALGALAQIQNANRRDIRFITGFGGTRDTYARFEANDPVYIASMSYFPNQGADAVEITVRILKGQLPSRDTVLSSVVVDSSNVKNFIPYSY